MISKENLIHPLSRIIVFVLMIIGVFLSQDLLVRCLGYIILFVLLTMSGQYLAHLKIILLSGVPFLLMLLLVYGFLTSDNGFNNQGALHALGIFIKITSLTALFQFTFSLRATELIDLLSYSKLPSYIKVIILESYSGIKDLANSVDQILTARYSRGFVKKRGYLSSLKQLPYLFRPMVSGLLLGSFEKSANWKQLKLMEQFKSWTTNKKLIGDYPIGRSIVVVVVVSIWFMFSVISNSPNFPIW